MSDKDIMKEIEDKRAELNYLISNTTDSSSTLMMEKSCIIDKLIADYYVQRRSE